MLNHGIVTTTFLASLQVAWGRYLCPTVASFLDNFHPSPVDHLAVRSMPPSNAPASSAILIVILLSLGSPFLPVLLAFLSVDYCLTHDETNPALLVLPLISPEFCTVHDCKVRRHHSMAKDPSTFPHRILFNYLTHNATNLTLLVFPLMHISRTVPTPRSPTLHRHHSMARDSFTFPHLILVICLAHNETSLILLVSPMIHISRSLHTASQKRTFTATTQSMANDFPNYICTTQSSPCIPFIPLVKHISLHLNPRSVLETSSSPTTQRTSI